MLLLARSPSLIGNIIFFVISKKAFSCCSVTFQEHLQGSVTFQANQALNLTLLSILDAI
jgi:hypothetical protein